MRAIKSFVLFILISVNQNRYGSPGSFRLALRQATSLPREARKVPSCCHPRATMATSEAKDLLTALRCLARKISFLFRWINFCLKISLPPSLRSTSLVRGRQYEFCIDIKQIFKQNSQSSRYLLIFIGNDALPPSDEGGGLP